MSDPPRSWDKIKLKIAFLELHIHCKGIVSNLGSGGCESIRNNIVKV